MLASLVNYYEKLVADGKICAPGWVAIKVSYAINIDSNGNVMNVQSLLKSEQRGKKQELVPTQKSVPLHTTRSGAKPMAFFMCDNAKYVLGAYPDDADDKTKQKAKECFETTKDYHIQIMEGCTGLAAKAIIAFYSNWEFERDKCKLDIDIADLLKAPNVVFRLFDTAEYALEDNEIKQKWNDNYNTQKANEGQCLVTGKTAPIARLHPLIKGVRGAQSSGAALVSFNAKAFESYGKEQGENAPVSEYAANAYGTAINYLLSRPACNMLMGDTTVIFWADTGEENYSQLYRDTMNFDSDDKEKVKITMYQIAKGQKCEYDECDIDPNTKFYIVGLSPNAARLSVRFFYVNKFGNLISNINEHYKRLEIVKPSFVLTDYPGVRDILYETVNRKSNDKASSPLLGGTMMKAILSDTRYPALLYTSIITRIRSDKIIIRNRAATIKAYLLKNTNQSKEVLCNMGLVEDSDNEPYLLGRLFSVLEEIQAATNDGLNTTIKDKYFNSACATPAVVFPQLLKLKNNHIKVIQREKKGYAVNLEIKMGEIINKLGSSFPRQLSLEEQGMFILGYYQQTQKRYEKKEDK